VTHALPGQRIRRLRAALRVLLPWLRWGTAALLVGLLLLDIAFPLPLPRAETPRRW